MHRSANINDRPAAQAAPPGRYVGRFAPSPTGRLHAGSLVAAMASWLDARAHGGRWLLRIEDIDTPRVAPGAEQAILDAMTRLGFIADGPLIRQSLRQAAYQRAFDELRAARHVYPCACTRREITRALAIAGRQVARNVEPIYPGTCRDGLPPGRTARSWRVRVDDAPVRWRERWDGREHLEHLPQTCGDFVIRRADGIWAYQLVVVVDDGASGVTDVVRGADLASSTARQQRLHQWLGHRAPRYLHVPVVATANGEKLSKGNGARPLELSAPLRELQAAAMHLGLGPIRAASMGRFWELATQAWARRLAIQPGTTASK